MYGGVWRGLLAPVTAAVSSAQRDGSSLHRRLATFLIFAHRNEIRTAHVPDPQSPSIPNSLTSGVVP
jgi:hypothetical protein